MVSRAALTAVVAVIAWGVLTFGGVYPWAYWPLLGGAALCGLWLLVSGRRSRPDLETLAIVALLLGPPLVQLVAVPQQWLEAVAPKTVEFLRAIDFTFSQSTASHPLSVNAPLTRMTLLYLAIGILWIAGLARGLRTGIIKASTLVGAVTVLAVLVAMEALAQKAMFNGKIYWFWESQFKVAFNHFGPFVNRNHFAGWMLLALCLGSGYMGGRLAQAGARLKSGWREYFLWVGSPEASGIIATMAGLSVMAISLVWTLSRSGMAAACVALSILTAAGLGAHGRGWRKIIVTTAIVFAIAGAATWRGLDTVAASYGDTRTLEWRFALWGDTVAPLKDFWRLGSGLNTYGTVMILYPQSDPGVHARQAHNDYLQLAVEGGALVIVPWLLAGALLARRIPRRLFEPQDEMSWWIRMGAVAGICGIAVQELSDFSLQIPGVALLFATCVALAVHEPARSHSRRRTSAKATREFASGFRHTKSG